MKRLAVAALALSTASACAQVSDIDVEVGLSELNRMAFSQTNEDRPFMDSKGRLDDGAGARIFGAPPINVVNAVATYTANEIFIDFSTLTITDTIRMQTILVASTDLPALGDGFSARRAAESNQSVQFDVDEPVGYRVAGHVRTTYDNPQGEVNAFVEVYADFDEYATGGLNVPENAEIIFEREGIFDPSPFYRPRFSAEIYIDSLSPDAVASLRAELLLEIEFFVLDCLPADLAEPIGVLDISDVQAFLIGFANERDVADIAEPFGAYDYADVFAFLSAFAAGCP